MGIRHTRLTSCTLCADELSFEVDAQGRLVPDPSPELAGRLLQLANFEAIADLPAPVAKPKPAPRTTKKRRAKKTEES